MRQSNSRAWLTIISAAGTLFLLGAIYAYGVLLPEIMAAYGWESSVANLPQAVLLFVYAIGMAVGGILQDRLNPSRVVTVGGLLFALGLLAAGRFGGLLPMVLFYGVIGGIGFGFAYVAAVTTAMKSLPERRGLVAGIVVGAFGLSSIVWAPLAQRLLDTIEWRQLLMYFGALMLIFIPLLGFGIRNPEVPARHDATSEAGLTLREALRSPLFWIVFAAYTLVTAAGLMWLTHYKTFGLSRGIPVVQAAMLVVITALGNGVGRIGVGVLSDHIGRFPALIAASVLGVVLFLLPAVGITNSGIFVIAGFIGVAFGTWLSLYGPTSTDLFGLKAAGAIYGTLYMSYGIGGLVGPVIGGYLADVTGNYRLTFVSAAGLCLLAAILFIVAMRMSKLVYRHPNALAEEFPVD